ncbi:VOC family protein, partial [Rhizobium leguminosarum]
PLPADRGALETHANGVIGITEIALCAPAAAAFAAFVGLAVAQAAVEKTSFGVNIAASNAKISLMTPEGLEAYFDIA